MRGGRLFPEGLRPAGRHKRRPLLPATVLSAIILGCLVFPLLSDRNPAYMDLAHYDLPPCGAFLFGTDSLGRDIFWMIWHGGRVSLSVGFLAAAVSAAAAMAAGALSGLAPAWLDAALMRLTELLLSIPGLLLTVFLQAVLGEADVLRLSAVIGMTGWMSMAKVVRTEVRQLRESGYVEAARCMGAGFFHILSRHIAPNVFPSILFMTVMNIRSAIAAEATLSFMGMGLPLETVSWGGMLSAAERALLGGCWWAILIPGAFLLAALMCVSELGEYLRGHMDRRQSNL